MNCSSLKGLGLIFILSEYIISFLLNLTHLKWKIKIAVSKNDLFKQLS